MQPSSKRQPAQVSGPPPMIPERRLWPRNSFDLPSPRFDLPPTTVETALTSFASNGVLKFAPWGVDRWSQAAREGIADYAGSA